jgi:hypothetical protein
MARDMVTGRKLPESAPPKRTAERHGFEVYEPVEHKKQERLFERKQPWEPIPLGERIMKRVRKLFGIKKRRKDGFGK